MSNIKLQQKARGARPNFSDDPSVDRLIAIVTALAGEVSVLHDQIDSVRRVLDQKGVITSEDLDAFVVDESVDAERDEWREMFLDNVFRIVHQEQEALAEGDQTDEAYAKIVDEVDKV